MQTQSSGNSIHLYQQAGLYQVGLLLTDANSCQDSISVAIAVDSLPQAFFTAQSVCIGDTIDFVDMSRGHGSPIISWGWDFGDQTSAAGRFPRHQYAASGNYTVRLLVTDQAGCEHAFSRQVQVFAAPSADFRPSDSVGCVALSIRFFDFSAGSSSAITGWQWNFGGQGSATAPNPTFNFTQTGTYTISLVVSDQNQCKDTAEQQIEVYPLPQADFISADTFGCSPKAVSFSDRSVGLFPIVNWQWSFGDGTFSNDSTPNHTYLQDGNYTVTLTVTDLHGCSHTTTKNQFIRLSHPMAQFSASTFTGCPGTEITFQDGSLADTTLVQWEWDFGDGAIDRGAQVTHTYLQPGIYQVTVIVTNILGCKDTLISPQVIRIFEVPQAAFEFIPNPVCADIPFQVRNRSIPGSGQLREILWDFGLGDKGSGNSVFHTYSQSGNYPVLLTVVDENGCRDSISQIQEVWPRPRADFEVIDELKCAPSEVRFIDRSQDSSILVDWLWDFGDGSLAERGRTILHGYIDTLAYDVRLVVTDKNGCRDTAFRVAAVDLRPTHYKPEIIRATVVDNSFVRVEWKPILQASGATIHLERAIGPFGQWEPWEQFDVADTTFDDKETNVQVYSYRYRIRIQDKCGNLGSWSNIGKSILLKRDYGAGTAHFYWSAYQQWRQDVWRYEIQADGPNGFEFFDRIDGPDTSLVDEQYKGAYCTYRVKAIERNGNNAESYSNYVTIAPATTLFAPSGFTPNGDGINDEFFVSYSIGIKDFNIKIFSRWGNLIYESDQPDFKWNGTYNGVAVPEGVYVFVIRATGVSGCGREAEIERTVTVIR